MGAGADGRDNMTTTIESLAVQVARAALDSAIENGDADAEYAAASRVDDWSSMDDICCAPCLHGVIKRDLQAISARARDILVGYRS